MKEYPIGSNQQSPIRVDNEYTCLNCGAYIAVVRMTISDASGFTEIKHICPVCGYLDGKFVLV